MTGMGKLLIITGLFLVGTGALMLRGGKFFGLGKLPGDIMIKKNDFTFFFPVATCIVISIILSFILYLWNQK